MCYLFNVMALRHGSFYVLTQIGVQNFAIRGTKVELNSLV
jgi:hypothetical protein